MTNRINFFKEAVKSLKTSGTVTPSSRFLAKRMLSKIDFSQANLIVELGPGNGVITNKILAKLNPNAKLICFEINENFYAELQKNNHPQLIVLNQSAEDIRIKLEELGFSKIDHIVSSLPLTIIPKEITSTILTESYSLLKEEGTFIQYQYLFTYLKTLKQYFNEHISMDFEVLNFPPAFVYRCKKIS